MEQSYSFLFWNVNQKNLVEEIKSIVEEHRIDVIILAEFPEGRETALHFKLNENSPEFYPSSPLSFCEKIKIFTRFHFDFIRPVYESNRITIREIKFPIGTPAILVGLHLPDKGNFSVESQAIESSFVIDEIKKVEHDLQNKRTIVIGDFNMNPFEAGMIQTNGFHATMSSSVARNISRTVQRKEFSFFYNPMWNLYGDLYSNTIAGTYYYRHAEHISYDWNLFDQVLIRPELIDSFDKGSLKILENIGILSLITESKIPDDKKFSDHLPIIFTLKI